MNGATFGRKTRVGMTPIFRPTTMSVALAAAGILPGTHMVAEEARAGLLRHRNDMTNLRPSVHVSL